MYDGKKTLLDIFRLGLRSQDPDLRDAIVTYIAIERHVDALHVLEGYIPTEELPWLQEYAQKVAEHLRKRLRGEGSDAPRAIDGDTTVMHHEQSLELRWKSRFPDIDD